MKTLLFQNLVKNGELHLTEDQFKQLHNNAKFNEDVNVISVSNAGVLGSFEGVEVFVK